MSRLHQLPPPPPAFTGRDEELGELASQLTSGAVGGAAIHARHAGLQGMGGVGKTALAIVLAHRLLPRYPDAQIVLNLRGTDPDRRPPVAPIDAMQSVLHCFHPEARLPDTLEQMTPLYNSVLAGAGRVLLMLDNAASAAQVAPLVPPSNCLLLVTSRKLFQLPGLTTRNLDCLSPEASRALLCKLAPRLAAHASEAAELCGHLPLALEVFAGAINDKSLFPVPDLLSRLSAGTDKLAPVEAAFDLSTQLLTVELRHRLELLSVFPASFELRAAAAVWADVSTEAAREPMQALYNANLVQWNEATRRFRLHDLVRLFGDSRLSADQRISARLRHAQHYRDVGAEADRLYRQGNEALLQGVQLFDRERSHLEAAVSWLGEQSDSEAAALLVSLVDGVGHTADLRFHPGQRIAWRDAQLRATRIAGDRRGEGYALGNLGYAYYRLGDQEKAFELLEQALILIREFGDRRAEGAVLGNLGLAHADSGNVSKASELFEHALLITREIGDRRGEGTALNNLGNTVRRLADPQRAVVLYEQALTIHREIGDRRAEGNTLGNLGNAYANLGDARKAVALCEQALVIFREIDDRQAEGNALFNAALQLWQLGHTGDAIARAETALQIFEAIEDPNVLKARVTLGAWRKGK